MAKHKRLSRDQQRKAKLAKRAGPGANESSLAYTGNKYKTDEYVPIVYRTELGIHETDVMLKKELVDADVRIALEKLVGQLRHGSLPALEVKREDSAEVAPTGKEDMLIWNIRRNWQILFEEQSHPRCGSGTLIGILRTLLGSLEVWGSPGRHSRGYLSFLEGFMRKTGVNVQGFSSEMMPLDEPPEDELLQLGREWCSDESPSVAEAFRQMAEQCIRAGQADRVVQVSQQLLGEFGQGRGDPVTKELSRLSLRAQETMKKRLT